MLSMANLISSVYYRMILHSTHSFWARLQVPVYCYIAMLFRNHHLKSSVCWIVRIFTTVYCCTLSISLRATLTLPLAHTVSSQFDLVLSMLPWLQITAIFTKKQEGDDENYDNFTIISERANKKFGVQKTTTL